MKFKSIIIFYFRYEFVLKMNAPSLHLVWDKWNWKVLKGPFQLAQCFLSLKMRLSIDKLVVREGVCHCLFSEALS